MDKKNVSQLLVNYSYLSAKIFDANGDLGKRWYLEYYVESIRHRQYLNKGKSPNERYQIATNILATFESVALDSPIPYYVNVVLIVNSYLEFCEKKLRARSFTTYKSKLTVFKSWVIANKVAALTGDVCKAFFEYLLITRKASNRTYNSYLNDLSVFYGWYAPGENCPFRDVKRKSKNSKPCMFFSDAQIKRLKRHIEPENPHLWLACQLTYYCLLRENEVRNLKVENILVEENRIVLPAEHSKTGRERMIVFNEDFKEVLRKWKFEAFPQDFYVIGLSENRVGRDWIVVEHRKYLKALHFDTNMYKHYSWKNSGIKNMLENGTPLKIVSQIAGHKTTQQTEDYVRHWGVAVEIKEKIKIMSI